MLARALCCPARRCLLPPNLLLPCLERSRCNKDRREARPTRHFGSGKMLHGARCTAPLEVVSGLASLLCHVILVRAAKQQTQPMSAASGGDVRLFIPACFLLPRETEADFVLAWSVLQERKEISKFLCCSVVRTLCLALSMSASVLVCVIRSHGVVDPDVRCRNEPVHKPYYVFKKLHLLKTTF